MQVLLGFRDSDRRFRAAGRRRVGHLLLEIPSQDPFHKRRARRRPHRVGNQVFAAPRSGYMLGSTPPRWRTTRSCETVKRAGDSALADAIGHAAGYGCCPSLSRFFSGMRLHLLAALDGTPRAATHWSPERGEREVAITLLARGLHSGETGQELQAAAAESGATIMRSNRKTEAGHATDISAIRQREEWIIQSTRGTLGLERHGGSTLRNLRVRICIRLLAVAAYIAHHHQLGLPSRDLVPYVT